MKTSLLIGSLFWGTCVLLQAQTPPDTSKTLPPGPLINKLPENSQCVITLKNVALEKAAADGKPGRSVAQRITMIRAGKYGLKTTEDVGSGTASQQWTVGPAKVTFDPKSKETSSVSFGEQKIDTLRTGETAIVDLPFPGIACVKAKFFTGVSTAGGRRTLGFSDPDMEASALVDFQSRLPMAAQEGDIQYTYQFSVASSSVLSPPSEVLKAIADAKAIYERTNIGVP